MKFTRKKVSQIRKEKKHYYYGLLLIVFLLFICFYFLVKKNNLNSIISNFSIYPKPILIPFTENNTKNKIINELLEKNISVVNIKEQDNYSYRLLLEDGIIVLIGSNEIENKVASLQFILKRFKIEGRTIKSIDLRFQKPVIK